MKNEADLEELLKELGWADGFHIPIANEENKALEMEVKKKQKDKDNLKSSLDDINDRLSAMKTHLSNVEHEQIEHQHLISAYRSQIKTEESLLKLAQGEEGSLTADMKCLKKECGEIYKRQKGLQHDIDMVLEHLEKLKVTVKWDKEALVAWDEEVSRGDEDTIILEKFTKDDEAKFKALELKRQNLRMEVETKRKKLETVKNEVICMEQALDKTSQMFRRQHVDRKALVRQWEGSVRVLRQRDEDINRTVEEIGALRALAKERMKDLQEAKTFYENEMSNNRELEKEIEAITRESADVKEKNSVLESSITEMNSTLYAMKGVLSNITARVHNQRSRNKQLSRDMVKKIEQTGEMEKKMVEVKEEQKKVKNKNMSAVDRVSRLEEMYKTEERMMERIVTDCKKLGELMFQVSEQLNELKDGEKQQRRSMESIDATEIVLKRELVKTEAELARQKEVLYNMDFAFMEKDMMLNRMLGSVAEDERENYDKRIAELEAVHEKVTATHSLLTKEVNRLEEEMRRLTSDLYNDSKELGALKSKRQDNILLTDGGQKQLKALRIRNQDRQVDENVLKLRVKQSEKAIEKVGGKVFSLEKQRLELEEAMKEREIEIGALRDVLTVRRRVLTDQAANLNGQINLGRIKVEQLKKKYEVAIGNLGTDEDGQQLSVTYFKIKTAQEKFELQEVGDRLDAKIRRTEKEITAMENTLKVVNATNKAFKNNLQQIDDDSPEQAEKEVLEKCYMEALEELKAKKAVLEDLNVTTLRMEEQYQEQLRVEEEILTAWKEKDQQATELDKDLRDQEEKLTRAEKQLRKLIREVRGTQVTKFQTVEEKDIELRELMEQNQSGLQQLAELVIKTFDTGPVVTRYLAEKGLSLPMMKSPSSSIKYASSSSLISAGRMSASSKSTDQGSSRTSSCAVTPSVVTLDSSRLGETEEGPGKTTKTSLKGKKASAKNAKKDGEAQDSSCDAIKTVH